jgi:dihydroorotate dehydrogenase (NAD+) catalytic subunit
VASVDLTTRLGPLALGSPLVAASGTVGSVWEWAEVADVTRFGAAVAKSVAPEPWPGRPAPRVAPIRTGMINGIGIQNPGIEAWVAETAPRLKRLDVPVWGSAVGHTPAGFAEVAAGLSDAGVSAIEVNLSCPNLDDGTMFSFEAGRSREVIAAVVEAAKVPVGAKLSPNTPHPVEVASACVEAGAVFLTLTNTALGLAIDTDHQRPVISGGVGGYSGAGLKPLSLRCVYEVSRAMPDVPIVGCGGVASGTDVIEYLMAGASAVGVGTALMAEPKAGTRILKELIKEMEVLNVGSVEQLVGAVATW